MKVQISFVKFTIVTVSIWENLVSSLNNMTNYWQVKVFGLKKEGLQKRKLPTTDLISFLTSPAKKPARKSLWLHLRKCINFLTEPSLKPFIVETSSALQTFVSNFVLSVKIMIFFPPFKENLSVLKAFQTFRSPFSFQFFSTKTFKNTF
jgi:hypothetical protein